ncbi:hypothetical protein JIR23_06955 [Bradyrhizobium diazoefficiens]|nr:hypothetical protein [Bradyrhizobium diazoefficiens]QQN67526.1 hypothetical protein JIR23_06955 [Bradyrhizobium diazoefficiens]
MKLAYPKRRDKVGAERRLQLLRATNQKLSKRVEGIGVKSAGGIREFRGRTSESPPLTEGRAQIEGSARQAAKSVHIAVHWSDLITGQTAAAETTPVF